MMIPSQSHLARALAAAVLLGAVACSGDDDGTTTKSDDTTTPTGDTGMGDDDDDTGDDDDDDDDDDVTSQLNLTLEPSLYVPSVLHLTGDSPADATMARAVATPTLGGDPLTVEVDVTAKTPFLLPLAGLVQAAAYDVSVELLDSAGTVLASEDLPVTAPAAPPIFQAVTAVKVDEPIGTNYVALAFIGNDDTSFAVVLDDQGQVVWWKPAEPGQIILTPVLSRDGNAMLWGEYDAAKTDDTGTWFRVRLDGTEQTSRRLQLSHHAAVEMPDGGVAWLGLDFRDIINTDDEPHRMASDRIYEGPAVYDATPVEVFNTFDDHPDEPTFTCEHMTDDFERFGESVLEWTHGNSLAYLESEDAFYLNAKTTDWLLKIDRATGNLIWQLGGIGSDFTFPDGSPTFTSAYTPELVSHAHMSEVWEGGMVIFDNGDHRDPVVSSVAELAWDETLMTVERTWEYYHPGGRNTFALGDVKKLDDGSYLVGWGSLSEVMVVTPDHQVSWHVTIPSRYTVGRVLALEHL